LRTAPVAIAQSWAGNAFRLEHDWPIPGTTSRTFWLSRTAADAPASGHLTSTAPDAAEVADTLANVPVAASGPSSVPYAPAVSVGGDRGVPGAELVYLSSPFTRRAEIAGAPMVRLWVRSSNAAGAGQAQLHVALAAVSPSGQVTELARSHRGYRHLGPRAIPVAFPLTVASARLSPGMRLMLEITPTDVAVSVPFATADTATVVHDRAHPSAVQVPFAPVDRRPPPGAPPTGPAFPQDATSAVCAGLGLPCG
jgi:predicted acyl esterase